MIHKLEVVEVIWMKNAVIYVHGKGGNAEEADHYKQFFDDSFEIIGFDYKSLNRGMLKLSLEIISTPLFLNIIKFI